MISNHNFPNVYYNFQNSQKFALSILAILENTELFKKMQTRIACGVKMCKNFWVIFENVQTNGKKFQNFVLENWALWKRSQQIYKKTGIQIPMCFKKKNSVIWKQNFPNVYYNFQNSQKFAFFILAILENTELFKKIKTRIACGAKSARTFE